MWIEASAETLTATLPVPVVANCARAVPARASSTNSRVREVTNRAILFRLLLDDRENRSGRKSLTERHPRGFPPALRAGAGRTGERKPRARDPPYVALMVKVTV